VLSHQGNVLRYQTYRLTIEIPLGGDIMSNLQGKIAVIPGSNSGIGLATAVECVAEGAYVFITGRRQKELDAAAASIGRNVTAVQGDVSKLAVLDRLYAQVAKEKGRVDIVLANAGTGLPAPIGQITERDYDQVFNVNLRGLPRDASLRSRRRADVRGTTADYISEDDTANPDEYEFPELKKALQPASSRRSTQGGRLLDDDSSLHTRMAGMVPGAYSEPPGARPTRNGNDGYPQLP
jgi:NAD(P)-dependent dehydrogenase (short-subunit alcohol dehydrogenase family)